MPENQKPKYVFDVTTFGADRLGIANSASAIQRCATAAAAVGGEVYFPAGTYLGSPSLSGISGIVFRGDGASSIIKASSVGSNALTLVSCSDIVVSDLKLLGPNGGGTATNVDNGIHLDTCDSVSILRCQFEEHGFAGICMNKCSDIWIDSNKIQNNATSASTNSADIFAYGTTVFSKLKISNNLCLGDNSAGIQIAPSTANVLYQDVSIKGNTCRNHLRYGIICYVTLSAGTDATLRDVVIYGNVATDNGWGGIYLQSIDNATVCGNITARNNTGGSGSGIQGGIHINGGRNTTVSGNLLYDEIGNSIRVSGHATFTQRRESVAISGNTIRNSGTQSIYINNTIEGATLSGNTIIGGASQAIYVDGTAGVQTDVSAVGNLIDGAATASRGIDLNGALSGGVISGNVIRDVTGPAIRIASANNACVHGNNCSGGTYGIEVSGTVGKLEMGVNQLSGTTGERLWTASTFNADGFVSISGAGAPSFIAPIGSLYSRTDGSTSTSLYVNEDGTGTGWVAK